MARVSFIIYFSFHSQPVYLKFDLKNNEGIVRMTSPPSSTSPSSHPFLKSFSSSSSSSNGSRKLCRSCSVDIEDPLVKTSAASETPRHDSPISLKNIPVKQISFDDSMNLKGSKSSLSSVGLQFSIDPGLGEGQSNSSSRKSSIKSILIDKIKIVKRVNSESECSCPAPVTNSWRARSVSLASSSPAASPGNANNPHHVFVRSISKLKLRNEGGSLDTHNSQVSLPRLESHHSSSDEDWFEQVEEKIIAVAGEGKSRAEVGTDDEAFGSTSCFRLHKTQLTSPYRVGEGNCEAQKVKKMSTSNSKLNNIISMLKKQNRNSIIREEDVQSEKAAGSASLGEKSGGEVEEKDVVEEVEGDVETGDEMVDRKSRKKKKKKKRKRKEGERRKVCEGCCSVS